MDASEELADRYLRSLGFECVVFEPDGNVPPDFLVDGRIAVEVRRLNQNAVSEAGIYEGLEEVSIPLWQRMTRLLPTIGASVTDETWFVAFDFRRPLDPWKLLEPKIKSVLLSFLASPSRSMTRLQVAPNFEIAVYPASRWHGSPFILGGATDDDSGGFVLGEVHSNLQLCSGEKERKIASFRSKYPQWWLVLPDHIGYGVDYRDREDYAKVLSFPHH